MLVVVSAALLVRDDVRLPGAGTPLGVAVVGPVSGALASSTGLSGPPAALLLESRGLPKETFRATIALYFLGLDAALLVVLALWGELTPSLAPLALVLVSSTLVGKATGTALFKRASQATFRAVVLGTVILTGVLGVATALRAIL